MPKKTLVLKIEKASNAFEIFNDKICIIMKTLTTKIPKISKENTPSAEIPMKNQKENARDTVRALNLADDKSILNRIN